ncbi:MAG: signal recognition particle-docking protein FtsY [Candidatus Eisenbacteria bacterium]|nr:signal recognition particle-docking protein FtsY [Candidatus Eisenbacteria bacterium]
MKRAFTSLLRGLAKTRRAIEDGIESALGRGGGLDETALEEIEETLIAADVGVETSLHLVDSLRVRRDRGDAPDDAGTIASALADEVKKILEQAADGPPVDNGHPPHVIMVVGVNGVGKTTTIGKLAHRHVARGNRVVLAASDTFRAAAGEQLTVWAQRSGADLVGGHDGGDPASVAYDALDAAAARKADVLIVDTAGRLHTQKNLISEIEKIKRVLGKRMPGAPHEVLLVLDANTGQNAVAQAKLFDEALGVTGIVLAKLDGTARGGIVVAIARELGIPVRYVGLGENIEDLADFEPGPFADALVGAAGGESPANAA